MSTPSTSYDLDSFLATIDELKRLDLDLVEDMGLPPNFKPTQAFTLILERIQYARKMNTPLALITGAHGAGKTTAISYYAKHQEVLFWECTPNYHPKHVLTDVAANLGINAGTSWRMQTSIVIAHLKSEPRTIILDEAQRLNYDGMDLLKYIADSSGSTFILCASPSLETRIDRWPDISSRCTVRARVSTMTLEEFTTLYRPEGYATVTLAEMHRLSRGIMRTLQHLILHLDEAIADYNARKPGSMSRGKLQPGHVRRISEQVMGT